MPIAVGKKIGPYEIVAPLGAGGMGEVYRARDPRFGREVAVKVLPSSFSSDTDRLQRFEQEARAAGILNHPNILSVYDIGTQDGSPYLVSELLEGETLRGKLQAGALPQRKAIDYGLQIAKGLFAAHEKGIVHRDLKPENLFITKDGRAKILDFGLAKLTQPEVPEGQLTQLPTTPGTEPGLILGTVGYMSPEQVRGRVADHRSDIFTFGAILYEMFSGVHAFRGDTNADTLSAIIHKDPPEITKSNPEFSPALERIVDHCLEKDPEQRFQSASDIAFSLEALSGLSGSAVPTVLVPSHVKVPIWVRNLITVIAVLIACVFAIAYFQLARRPSRIVRASIDVPEKWTFNSFMGGMALSPDGRRLVFVASSEDGKQMILLRALDQVVAQPVVGTESGYYPFWSPDSQFIGFFANGKLKKINPSGGPAETICETPDGRGGTWNRDGIIVFAPSPFGSLYQVLSTGSKPTPVTPEPPNKSVSHRWPYFLPDGRHFLYTIMDAEPHGIFIGSLDSKEVKQITPDLSNAAYSPAGYLLFLRDGNLMALPFDANKLAKRGEPFAIGQQQVSYWKLRALALFTVAQNGPLIYQANNILLSQLIWFDRAGKRTGTIGEPGYYLASKFSPDEKRIAVIHIDPQTQDADIWIHDTVKNNATRFTFEPGLYTPPVWSPDGTRITFSGNSGMTIYQKLTSGVGGQEPQYQTDFYKRPTDWSSDGRLIAYMEQSSKGTIDLWMLPTFGDRKPFVFLATPFQEDDAQFSPNGKWIAYSSNASGRSEVYVRPYSGSAAQWQISNNGGGMLRWREDGKELFYISNDQKVMAVRIKEGASFEFEAPEALFTLPEGWVDADVSADGQRFLVDVPVGRSKPAPIVLVLNWTTGLKK